MNIKRIVKLLLFSTALLETKVYIKTVISWLDSYFGNGLALFNELVQKGYLEENNTTNTVKLTNKLYFEYSLAPALDYYFSADIKAFNTFKINYLNDRYVKMCLKYIASELNCGAFIYKINPNTTKSVTSILASHDFINTNHVHLIDLEKIILTAQTKYFRNYLYSFFVNGGFKDYIRQTDSITNIVIKKLNLSLNEFVLVSKMIKINDFWYIIGVVGPEKLNVIRSTSLLNLVESQANGDVPVLRPINVEVVGEEK